MKHVKALAIILTRFIRLQNVLN